MITLSSILQLSSIVTLSMQQRLQIEAVLSCKIRANCILFRLPDLVQICKIHWGSGIEILQFIANPKIIDEKQYHSIDLNNSNNLCFTVTEIIAGMDLKNVELLIKMVNIALV